MIADFTLWNAIVSTATLVVVAVAALGAFRQIRQLRAQTSLAGFLKVLDDWRDPDFKRDLEYVRQELPAKMREPGFFAELDDRPDRRRHPELNVCDWYEQLGAYVKHGLLDEEITMDVSSSSANALWAALEPVIMRMRETRGEALYENFEYMAARGVLFQRKHPKGCYPRDTPRMAELGGAHAYGRKIAAPAEDVPAAEGSATTG